MRTHIQKWGNSLAVRIPSAFARQVNLDANAVVDLTVVDGQLIIRPIEAPVFELDDLLAQITDDNRHGEVDAGGAVGNEIW